jgi:hypothetical protein
MTIVESIKSAIGRMTGAVDKSPPVRRTEAIRAIRGDYDKVKKLAKRLREEKT